MISKRIFSIILTALLCCTEKQTIYCNNTKDSSTLYITPLDVFIGLNPEVNYQKCFDKFYFAFQPFPLSINPQNHPHEGYFHETFILKIPNAIIQSSAGFVLYKNQIVKELIWKDLLHNLNVLHKIPDSGITPVRAKVAVITQPAYFNYWHWLTEVLTRLALLEMHNVSYDFLVVNQESHFMKETLQLWGVPAYKIIPPQNHSFCIKADEVIVPSMVSNISFGFVPFSCYTQPHLLKYVQEKLLAAAFATQPTTEMNKKIFISRKDSNIRNILNEDEIFALLKQHGFVRYELAKLSVVDQIHLFNQAEIIVSPQGTGLANSIFCNKDVKIIELFQGLNDATFWYLSQEWKFNYNPIKTVDFIPDWMTAWQSHTHIPLEVVDKILEIIDTPKN